VRNLFLILSAKPADVYCGIITFYSG